MKFNEMKAKVSEYIALGDGATGETAEEFYLKAIGALNGFTSGEERKAVLGEELRFLAEAYEKLGGAVSVLERECYESALDARSELLSITDSDGDKRALAVVCEKLGGAYARAGFVDSSYKELYERAFKLWDAIAYRTYLRSDRERLAASYDLRGDCLVLGGSSRALYLSGLAIREELVSEEPDAEARRALALSCRRLAHVEYALKEYERSAEYWARAAEALEMLAEGGTETALTDLAEAYTERGYDEYTPKHLKKAYELWSRLAESFPDKQYYSRKAEALELSLRNTDYLS